MTQPYKINKVSLLLSGSEAYEGRESGSLQWRQSRGEGGAGKGTGTGYVIQTGHVTHSFVLTYTPATDQYSVIRDMVQDQVGVLNKGLNTRVMVKLFSSLLDVYTMFS